MVAIGGGRVFPSTRHRVEQRTDHHHVLREIKPQSFLRASRASSKSSASLSSKPGMPFSPVNRSTSPVSNKCSGTSKSGSSSPRRERKRFPISHAPRQIALAKTCTRGTCSSLDEASRRFLQSATKTTRRCKRS